jgi:hypothetical protein
MDSSKSPKSPIPSTHRYELTSRLGNRLVYFSDQPLSREDLYVLSFSSEELDVMRRRVPGAMLPHVNVPELVATFQWVFDDQEKQCGGRLLMDDQVKLLKRKSYFVQWQDFKVSMPSGVVPRREFLPLVAPWWEDYARMCVEKDCSAPGMREQVAHAVWFTVAAAAQWEAKSRVCSPVPPGGAYDADLEHLEPERVGDGFNYRLTDKYGQVRRLAGVSRRLTPGELTQFRDYYNTRALLFDYSEQLVKQILKKPLLNRKITEVSRNILKLQREHVVSPEDLANVEKMARDEQGKHNVLDKSILKHAERYRRSLDFGAEYRSIPEHGVTNPREEEAARVAVEALYYALRSWELQG